MAAKKTRRIGTIERHWMVVVVAMFSFSCLICSGFFVLLLFRALHNVSYPEREQYYVYKCRKEKVQTQNSQKTTENTKQSRHKAIIYLLL